MTSKTKTSSKSNPSSSKVSSAKQPAQAVKDTLAKTVESLCARFGKGALMSMGTRDAGEFESWSTSSITIDKALGIGGVPKGRIVEIYGPESSGKTTLTLHLIASAQASGAVCAFVDAEHALDTRYAKVLGVRLDELLVSQPDHGEQALDIADALARSGAVNLVVVDSVAALIPKAELEGDMGDTHVGLQARLMSQAMRKLSGVCAQTGTTLVFINQLRQKIGVVFGSPEVTTGGQALKYYSSVRMDIRRIGAIKEGDKNIGHRTRVKVVKNKCAPPFGIAEFDIRWGHGIDTEAEILDLGLSTQCVQKAGSWLSFGDRRLGQGRQAALTAMRDDRSLRQEILDRARALERAPSSKAPSKAA